MKTNKIRLFRFWDSINKAVLSS